MTNVVEELGIPSFKTFMAYKDVFMIDDAEMLECYRHCANIGAIGEFKIDRMLRPQGRNFEGAPSAPDNVETAAVATIRQYRNVI